MTTKKRWGHDEREWGHDDERERVFQFFQFLNAWSHDVSFQSVSLELFHSVHDDQRDWGHDVSFQSFS